VVAVVDVEAVVVEAGAGVEVVVAATVTAGSAFGGAEGLPHDEHDRDGDRDRGGQRRPPPATPATGDAAIGRRLSLGFRVAADTLRFDFRLRLSRGGRRPGQARRAHRRRRAERSVGGGHVRAPGVARRLAGIERAQGRKHVGLGYAELLAEA
jgi:hypothetical protein